MENKDINKLKVGDKIFIAVYDIDTQKSIKAYRIVKDVFRTRMGGQPTIIVKCFNKLYQLKSWEIYKTKTAYDKRGGGMTIQKGREPSGYYCEL
jgi:hypothetical protein